MTENTSKILIGLSLLIFTVISILLVLPSSDGNISEPEQMNALTVINPDDPQLKNGEIKAVLFEYSDLQCPACSYVEKNIVEPVLNKNIEGLQFVFKHFPLQSIHPNAVNAGIAAESAHKQSKFFEMKSLLFEKQNEWSDLANPQDLFVDYANTLSLDIEKFKSDYESPELRQKLLNAYDLAKDNGLNSTPTLILNGKTIKASTAEELEALILSEISGN